MNGTGSASSKGVLWFQLPLLLVLLGLWLLHAGRLRSVRVLLAACLWWGSSVLLLKHGRLKAVQLLGGWQGQAMLSLIAVYSFLVQVNGLVPVPLVATVVPGHIGS
jgi:hypothetical protein